MLQTLREYQSDTFDDWRDLLEEQERRTRDELDASKVLPKLLVLLSSITGLILSSCSAAAPSYCAAFGIKFELISFKRQISPQSMPQLEQSPAAVRKKKIHHLSHCLNGCSWASV